MTKKASEGPPPGNKPPPPPEPPTTLHPLPSMAVKNDLVERELQKLWVMYNPSVKAVRAFLGPDSDGMADEAMLGAIHKARVIEMSALFNESVEWLVEHDFDVPISRDDVMKRSKAAAKHFNLIKEYKH